MNAGEHLADRPVRGELKYKRTKELRPRLDGKLSAKAGRADEAIKKRHCQQPYTWIDVLVPAYGALARRAPASPATTRGNVGA